MHELNPQIRIMQIASNIGRGIGELVFQLDLKERLEHEKRQWVDRKDWDIVVEFIAFLLHVANRFAFASIPSQRSLFITVCVLNAWAYLVKQMMHPDEPRREEIKEELWRLFDEREVEYGKYRWTTPENQPLKGDLFWEFGKRIAKLHGFENDFVATTEESMKAMEMVGILKQMFDDQLMAR